MPRVNPRSVLLQALREGARDAEALRVAIDNALLRLGRRADEQPRRWGDGDRLSQRHLCHLRKAGRVVRLSDGRWAIRARPLRLRWPLERTGNMAPRYMVTVTRGRGLYRREVSKARWERVHRALRARSARFA